MSGQGKLLFPVHLLFLSWLALASLAVAFGQVVVSGKEMSFSQALCHQLGPCSRGWVLGLQP